MTPPDFFFFCHEVSWKLVLNSFQNGWEFLCAQSSVLTPCCEWACPSPRAAPLGLCQARGPLFVLSHSDPLPWNFVSTRPAHFHGLKLSRTLLAGHLNRATLSSHPKSICMPGALQNRCHAEEATNDHGDKVSLTLAHFCCVSYRLTFWFYNNKTGLLSLVFPSPIVIPHPKGCLWKQGYVHIWGRAAALWNKGSAHNPFEVEPSSYIWSLLTEPMSLCLVTFR